MKHFMQILQTSWNYCKRSREPIRPEKDHKSCTLGKFWMQKSFIKNCWDFLINPIETSNLFFTYLRNTLENIIHWKYTQMLIYKNWKNFWSQKIWTFWSFSNMFESNSQSGFLVERWKVLTKILRIDQKLTFNFFIFESIPYLQNWENIAKISDGAGPPKMVFFGVERVWSFKIQWFGVSPGPTQLRMV